MRDSVKDFIKICRDNLDLKGPIYEFGSRWIPPQGKYADLRPLFPGVEYVGCDIEKGDGVDRILDVSIAGNILDNGYSNIAGTIIMADTLEHIEYPDISFENCYEMLKRNGVLIVTTVLDFVIHSQPDYWRFTPEGLSLLFRDSNFNYKTWYAGRRDFPHTVVGIGSDRFKEDMSIDIAMDDWKKRWTPIQGG